MKHVRCVFGRSPASPAQPTPILIRLSGQLIVLLSLAATVALAAAVQHVHAADELRVSLPAGSATDYPLQFGRPFAAGDIVGDPAVFVDGEPHAAAQADVKTRHGDGSVKFAVFSVVLPTLDTTERVLTFGRLPKPAAQPAPTPLADMLEKFDFEATIELAANGSPLAGAPVSARAMLAATTDAALAAETVAGGVQSRYWTQGPICTTVILGDHVGKAFDLGTNGTKAIRPLFHVQFWPTIGRYHVRHIVEIADVTKLKDEPGLTVAFTTGHRSPATRLEQDGVNLYAGTWQSRAYWGGEDLPRANVKHGVAALAKTRAMPNYDAGITMDEAALASYATDWESRSKALQANGYWQKAMATTGGRPDLGLMPKWDVVALYSGAAHMHAISEGQAELAGSWAFFFREGDLQKTTFDQAPGVGRVVSKLSRPTVFLGDNNARIGTGATGDRFTCDGPLDSKRDGWVHDSAHTPGTFWWQYVSTGQPFWHEKLLQMAAWSQFLVNPGVGYNSVGNGNAPTALILNAVQVRAWGWQFRNRARAWWAALDGSPERALFERSLTDAVSQRAGLYDVQGSMPDNPIRAAWNANHAAWYAGNPPTPRPNRLAFWDRKGSYGEQQLTGAIGSPPPDDWGDGATAPWMQNFVTLSLNHAVELGFEPSRPLADWCGALAIAIANSPEPRHLGDYVIPQTKNDGTFYQSLDDLFDGYAHDADGESPTSMRKNSADGFAAGGRPHSWTVAVEGFGSIAAAAIAMGNGAPGQPQAWKALEPWYRATRIYDHDPRYAIIPREAVSAPPEGDPR